MYISKNYYGLALTLILVFIFQVVKAQEINLTNSSIIISKKIESPVRETIVRVLQEEVEKRSTVKWDNPEKWSGYDNIAIVLSEETKLGKIPIPIREGASLPEKKAEGYRIATEQKDGKTTIWIIGADASGAMFGAGKLLRTLKISDNSVILEKPLDYATSPVQSIRGHQLGYRNTANSYDAWDVEIYEQYIRDLVIFGTNSIENIPFQDQRKTAVMKYPREEINLTIGKICADYGISYWLWTPVNFDLTDKKRRQEELDKHEAFYKKCAKIGDIFIPGADPGKSHPRDILPFMKDLYKILQKYHPGAGLWLSLQKFGEDKQDFFYSYIEKEGYPDWLTGVVTGPSSPPASETRNRLHKKYGHRLYPDITHNVRCEYPVYKWDQAFSLTVGREGINPRPNFFAGLHSKFVPYIDGFVSYSDGCHDDINKVTWSMRGWDPELEVTEIINDYSRFFFGYQNTETATNGILGLEQNWSGPLKANGSVETTFAYWKNLEKNNPQLSDNWRWQMLVLRAYYDTYIRRRLIYEEGLEKEANKILAQASELGADKAMKQALELVNIADTERKNIDIRDIIDGYCEKLFNSIGLQTSFYKYHAANTQRGCIYDFKDYPLNNRWWLEDEFKKIKEMGSEEEKLARLETIRTWENPGKGSIYVNVSNFSQNDKVLTTSYDACDVAWWESGFSRARLSSQLFQTDPVIEFEDLDSNGRYLIRVSGKGDALIRVDGRRLRPQVYNKEIATFKEFAIPKVLTQDGKITISFDIPEESHLRWKEYSHISDVWLIKK